MGRLPDVDESHLLRRNKERILKLDLLFIAMLADILQESQIYGIFLLSSFSFNCRCLYLRKSLGFGSFLTLSSPLSTVVRCVGKSRYVLAFLSMSVPTILRKNRR